MPTTLVTGASPRDREAAIAARLPVAAAPARADVSTNPGGTVPPAPHPAPHPAPIAPAPIALDAAAGAPPDAAGLPAVILEGFADPDAALAADTVPAQVHRIAPGCLCCAGNMVLRVTLNRLLRRPPAQLFISLADATHVGQLRAMLSAPPYDMLLSLCDDIVAPRSNR